MALKKSGRERSTVEEYSSLWERNFNAYLHRDKFAQGALGKLLSRGCQRQAVTRLLYDYCLDTSASENRIAAAKWRTITKLLRQIALMLDKVVQMLREEAETFEPIHVTAHFLKSVEEFLRRVLPEMERQTNLRRSHGKALHLARLSHYIRIAVGNYSDQEVAALVVAGLQGGHQDADFNGDAVRKIRSRFKRRNPDACELFEQQTAKYFAIFGSQGDPESKPPFLEWCKKNG